MKYQENNNCVINNKAASFLNTMWNLNYLDNSTRTFCFKLHNNTLGYNYTVSKFVRNHSPLCTFCTLSRNPDDERETPYHIFYSCRHVEDILLTYFSDVLTAEDFGKFNRNVYFGYLGSDNWDKNLCIGIVCLHFKKYIWQCKLGYKIPTYEGARGYVKATIKNIFNLSGKFRNSWGNAGIRIHF